MPGGSAKSGRGRDGPHVPGLDLGTSSLPFTRAVCGPGRAEQQGSYCCICSSGNLKPATELAADGNHLPSAGEGRTCPEVTTVQGRCKPSTIRSRAAADILDAMRIGLVVLVALGCTAKGQQQPKGSAQPELGYEVPSLCFGGKDSVTLSTRMTTTGHYVDAPDKTEAVILALECGGGSPDRLHCAKSRADLFPAETPPVIRFNLGSSDDPNFPLRTMTIEQGRALFRERADEATKSGDEKTRWTAKQISAFRDAFEGDFDRLSANPILVGDRISVFLIDPPNHRVVYYLPMSDTLWSRGEAACYDDLGQWIAATSR